MAVKNSIKINRSFYYKEWELYEDGALTLFCCTERKKSDWVFAPMANALHTFVTEPSLEEVANDVI